ncbi:MAG: hypothetical protein LLF76_12140 [Planctomycetaceae bacterium]|nr:hypothetical protein [Planctomycetaceae bacterium]
MGGGASNQTLARLVTSRNAAGMMIAANLLFVVISGVFVLLENLRAIYAAMGALAASGMFFLSLLNVAANRAATVCGRDTGRTGLQGDRLGRRLSDSGVGVYRFV